MNKYAFLFGSAPKGFRQKKLCEMQDFLQTEKGGSLAEKNICLFPGGISELLLEAVLNNAFENEASSILLYFCTKDPVKDDDETFFSGNSEIRKEILSYYAGLAEKCGISLQLIFESDCQFISEEKLGYES